MTRSSAHVRFLRLQESLLLALVLSSVSLVSPAPQTARERIAAHFRGWFAHFPGSEVSARPTREVLLPGLEAFRVERASSSKSHQEASIALYDASSDEVFVGDVLGDPGRAAANRPFEPGTDLPNIQTSLSEAFGLPVRVEMGGPPRGPLTPLVISIRQEKDAEAWAVRPGFVSKDGSALMLGEFQPLREEPAAFREKLLSQSEGVRTGAGRFTVTEFLDFQCDRCRVRTPDVRRAVEEKGGVVEVRFLPLVKTHDWAFAAAESAAALAGVKPDLYRRYEEAVFARSEGMNPKAARELASDIAEAAGAREAFGAEISTGRARDRVLRDIGLAMRLGIAITPAFLFRGTLVTGEKGLLETYLWERLPPAPRIPGKAP
jgi:Thioredoxin